MNWTGYYGFITCFLSLDKVIFFSYFLLVLRFKRTVRRNFLLLNGMMKNRKKNPFFSELCLISLVENICHTDF